MHQEERFHAPGVQARSVGTVVLAVGYLVTLAFASLACGSGSTPASAVPGSSSPVSSARSVTATVIPISGPAISTPTPVPSATRTPMKPLFGYVTPPPVSDPGLKAVIDALSGNDPAALKQLIALAPLPCAVPGGGIPSAPACPTGVAGGTAVETFPSGSCESSFLDAMQIDTFAETVAAKKQFVFAAFGDTAGPAQTTLVMEDGITHLANSYGLRDGHIVWAHFGCGTDQTPPNALQGVAAANILLAPPG